MPSEAVGVTVTCSFAAPRSSRFSVRRPVFQTPAWARHLGGRLRPAGVPCNAARLLRVTRLDERFGLG
ncbi:hypothetical protein GCM10010466_14210 [Planomonospora alba]|uniref:Uncharacterized protein n=1 Tax=Planomonospora alba TaxID=161354 RepID=A0ABP6MVN2_9ACTN